MVGGELNRHASAEGMRNHAARQEVQLHQQFQQIRGEIRHTPRLRRKSAFAMRRKIHPKHGHVRRERIANPRHQLFRAAPAMQQHHFSFAVAADFIMDADALKRHFHKTHLLFSRRFAKCIGT